MILTEGGAVRSMGSETKIVENPLVLIGPADGMKDQEGQPLCDLFSAISEMGDGTAIAQLNSEFTSLMDAIAITRGKGKMTIDIVVGPQQLNAMGEVVSYGLALKVKSSVPRVPPPAAIMYRWDNGRVSQHHPDQGRLFNGGK